MAFFIPSLFNPLQELLAKYKIWYDKYKYIKEAPEYLYIKPIPLLQCPMCLAFWGTLFVCLNNDLEFYSSVLIAFISYSIAKIYNK
jgi:hypothetical protein